MASPDETTTYTLIVDDGNNSISDTIIISVVICTGIENHSSDLLLEVYPNPVVDNLSVSLSNITSETKLVLLDSKGGELWKGQLHSISNNLKAIIEMSSYPAGIYFLAISNKIGELIQLKKVVKR